MLRRLPCSGSGARLGSAGTHTTPLYPQEAPKLRRMLAWCLLHKDSHLTGTATPAAPPGHRLVAMQVPTAPRLCPCFLMDNHLPLLTLMVSTLCLGSCSTPSWPALLSAHVQVPPIQV